MLGFSAQVFIYSGQAFVPKPKKQSLFQNDFPFLAVFPPQRLCKAESKAVVTQVISGRQQNFGCASLHNSHFPEPFSTHNKGLCCAQTQLGKEQGCIIW